jgi:hypothetical protein
MEGSPVKMKEIGCGVGVNAPVFKEAPMKSR